MYPDDNRLSLGKLPRGRIMKKQQRYTPEFRAEAVKLVSEQGLSQETAAKRLAIPKGTLAN
jgi:transposase